MNAIQGTASFTIPLNLSQSRPGGALELGLEYSSGGGGGVWGIGWQLGGAIDVTRQTRLGLPKYIDRGDNRAQEDSFVISGAEDLVPVYQRDGAGSLVRKSGGSGIGLGTGKEDFILDETIHDGFIVRQYRPRTEGLFSLVERWTDQLDPEDIHWRLISPTNEMTILGRDERSRILAEDRDGKRIFSWLACEWYDCRGNARVYEYKREDGDGVDLGQANERNRTGESRGTQRHLKRVR
ncbi:MAG: hypothetical protein M1839_009534 [Geoglossum umbratile]|nr:MAG: hypothetical protein M1839_009534 [Geoglossum umbratile]